jgi:glycosyltransferase involved in cell wall biosynthesis
VSPLASVILPTLNAEHTIDDQLKALSLQQVDASWEVVLADNGSTDGTLDVVAAWADRLPLTVVDAGEGAGVSYARNSGAKAARGQLLLFCDADDVVSSGWIAGMCRALQSCDAVAGRLDLDSLNDSKSRLLRGAIHLEQGLRKNHGFLPFASSANLGVKREVFERLGGFSEDYDYAAPDKNFSWRLQLAGYKLGFAADAVVSYRVRRDLWSNLKQQYRYGKSHPLLYRDFAEAGMPRSGIREGLVAWGAMLRRVRGIRSPRSRFGLMRELAMRLGRVVGSVEVRILYL